jgi:hypothetical protein
MAEDPASLGLRHCLPARLGPSGGSRGSGQLSLVGGVKGGVHTAGGRVDDIERLTFSRQQPAIHEEVIRHRPMLLNRHSVGSGSGVPLRPWRPI